MMRILNEGAVSKVNFLIYNL